MGAWGAGPFDNDDAMDFVGDLSDVPAEDYVSLLQAAVTPSDGYLESPDGSIAVAAAALIAAQRGYVISSPTVAELVQTRPFTPDDDMRASAVAALDRVAGEDSELTELWAEAGLQETVLTRYGEIRSFL